ncbi:hypothetical protein [Pseudomonas cichorii]
MKALTPTKRPEAAPVANSLKAAIEARIEACKVNAAPSAAKILPAVVTS